MSRVKRRSFRSEYIRRDFTNISIFSGHTLNYTTLRSKIVPKMGRRVFKNSLNHNLVPKLSFFYSNREKERKFRKSAARATENGPLQVALLLRSRLLGRFLVRELSSYRRISFEKGTLSVFGKIDLMKKNFKIMIKTF